MKAFLAHHFDTPSQQFEAGKLGTWNWDAATDSLTLGPRAAKMFGVAPGIAVTRARMRALLVAQDRQRSRKAMACAAYSRRSATIRHNRNSPPRA